MAYRLSAPHRARNPFSSFSVGPAHKFLSLVSTARRWLAALLFYALALGPAQGQGWELGAGAGFGFYRNGRVFAPAGIAAAGVRNRFTLTAWLAERRSERLAGELRYTYQDGDPFLESRLVRTNVQGQSHALHFALRLPLRAPEARFNPYLTAGLGAKRYEVTGPETLNPPLLEIARLRAAGEWKALVVAGVGADWVLHRFVSLRAEFLDYVTPFPKQVIEPAPYASARGFLHQMTPSLSLCWRIR